MVIRDGKIKFESDEIENLREFFDRPPFCGMIRCSGIECDRCPFDEATRKIGKGLEELDMILSERSNYIYDEEESDEE